VEPPMTPELHQPPGRHTGELHQPPGRQTVGAPVSPREVRVKKAAVLLVLALAAGATACSKGSGTGSDASATTASSVPAGATSPTSATETGPITDADVTDVGQILHRLDTELDRLDSDMATGEGDVQ